MFFPHIFPSSVFYKNIWSFLEKNELGNFWNFFPDANSTKLGKKLPNFLYKKIIKKKPCIGLRNIL